MDWILLSLLILSNTLWYYFYLGYENAIQKHLEKHQCWNTPPTSNNKYKTVWGLYYINASRTEGYSDFFDTYEEALNARNYAPQVGLCYVLKHTYYNLEEDSHHDCGDDE